MERINIQSYHLISKKPKKFEKNHQYKKTNIVESQYIKNDKIAGIKKYKKFIKK